MKLILPLLFALALASCRRGSEDSTWWNNQKTTIEVRNQIELAKYRAERASPAQEAGISSPTQASPETLRLEIAAMLGEKRNLTGEIAGMRSGWDEFRKDILSARRRKASGMAFAVFDTPDGRHFSDARITRIDDTGISLTHASGTARLRFGDLDADRQAFFGLDGELAGEAQQAETESRIAYERSIDGQLAVISQKEEKQRLEREKEEAMLASARAVAASARASLVRPLSASIGALGETSSVYGSRTRSSFSSYYRRPVVRYNYINQCNPSSSGIPFWPSNTHRNGTGGCVSPIQIRVPFYQTEP